MTLTLVTGVHYSKTTSAGALMHYAMNGSEPSGPEPMAAAPPPQAQPNPPPRGGPVPQRQMSTPSGAMGGSPRSVGGPERGGGPPPQRAGPPGPNQRPNAPDRWGWWIFQKGNQHHAYLIIDLWSNELWYCLPATHWVILWHLISLCLEFFCVLIKWGFLCHISWDSIVLLGREAEPQTSRLCRCMTDKWYFLACCALISGCQRPTLQAMAASCLPQLITIDYYLPHVFLLWEAAINHIGKCQPKYPARHCKDKFFESLLIRG